MDCKLCGKDLYEKITFYNLFKLNYYIHYDCQIMLNRSQDYFVFPLLDKLVMFDYLFPEIFLNSDDDFLFTKYGNILFRKALNNKEWSIIIIADDIIDKTTMILITKLAVAKILILSIYNVSFL